MRELPVYDICSLNNIKNGEILISRFAPYLKTHHKLLIPHRHNFYHLVLFTEGSGLHTIDFSQFPVQAWQIYFMIPGQVHSWDFEGYTDGYVINFSDSFFRSFLLRPDYVDEFAFFGGNAADSVINITKPQRAKTLAILEDLLACTENTGRLQEDRIRVLLLQLFILVEDMNEPGAQKGLPSYNLTLLRNFRKLIDKNYQTMRLPKEYANLLYITPNHLNAVSSEFLGMPAGELIRNRIALEAKRLLVNPALSVSEIAYQLNFNDNSYFTKFFKKHEGLTPEEFRKQLFQKKEDETTRDK